MFRQIHCGTQQTGPLLMMLEQFTDAENEKHVMFSKTEFSYWKHIDIQLIEIFLLQYKVS